MKRVLEPVVTLFVMVLLPTISSGTPSPVGFDVTGTTEVLEGTAVVGMTLVTAWLGDVVVGLMDGPSRGNGVGTEVFLGIAGVGPLEEGMDVGCKVVGSAVKLEGVFVEGLKVGCRVGVEVFVGTDMVGPIEEGPSVGCSVDGTEVLGDRVGPIEEGPNVGCRDVGAEVFVGTIVDGDKVAFEGISELGPSEEGAKVGGVVGAEVFEAIAGVGLKLGSTVVGGDDVLLVEGVAELGAAVEGVKVGKNVVGE